MKLLRLKITDPNGFRSLQAGFEHHFRTEWDLQEEHGFAPFVRFVVASDSDVQLKLHPYNEHGDVKFVSRSATKTLSERDQVARFLSLLIMYLVISPIFSIFSLSPFSEIVAGVVKLALLLALFRFIVPFSEVIAELVSK